jgi:hypothetical protein
VPGLDHEVHPGTQQSAAARYGCCGRPRTRKTLWVKDGFQGGVQMFKEIEDFGSLECRYDLAGGDRLCEGCQHLESGAEYAEEIRRKGT